MDCVLDWVPGSSLLFERKTPSTLGTPSTLRRNGVLCYDILGKRNYYDLHGFLPRFFFLLPGRLLYSRNLRSADDGLAEALTDADRNLRSLNITPNLRIEYINSKTFRVWNAVDWTGTDAAALSTIGSTTSPSSSAGKKRPDLAMEGGVASVGPTPDVSAVQFASNTGGSELTGQGKAIPLLSPSIDTTETDRVVSTLSPAEQKESLILLFSNKEQAKEWEKALFAERDKVYMQDISSIPSFARMVHFSVWKTVLANFEDSINLRKLYFDHETGPMVYQLARIFASGVPESLMLEHVDAFVEFLSIVARNLSVYIILLGFKLPQDMLAQYMSDKKTLATETPSFSFSTAGSGSSEAQEFVELVKYMAHKTGADTWARNRAVLPWLFGFPEKLKFVGARKWFLKISSARGKFSHPFKVSWAQLKLILEPTPFVGFWFVDHYVNVGDVKRARAVCAGLPYDMTLSFAAIYRSPEVQVQAAHFVHYLEWDALQRAYEEFEADNAHNEKLHDIIALVRSVYNAPLASAAHWATLAYVSENEVMDDCIAQLLDGMETETVPELVVVREICARWMQFTRSTQGFCKAPRKGYILTLLTVASWVQNMGTLPGKVHSKAIVALTALNEDRALITALIAIYLAKGLGKHVHILYSTSQSLFRDCTRLTPFFAMLDVTTAMNDFSSAADVTYCLQRDLSQFYRDSIFFGQQPFANTVLLIDDMDDLDIDRAPNSIYGKRDEELTAPLKSYFDVLLEHGDAATPPPGAESGPGLIAWNKSKQAYAQYRTMSENQPNGFQKAGARYELLDASGKLAAHRYSPGLEMVRYKLAGELPSINSKFFYQSLPHILGQYEGIVGLGSKALGDDLPTNRRFLEKMYGCWSFNVPPELAKNAFPTKENAGTISIVEETVVNADKGTGEATSANAPASAPAALGAAALSGDALGKIGLVPATPAKNGAPGGNGLDSRWATPPRTPDEKYEASIVSISDVYSTHYTSIPNLPDIVKGQMMNELCDKFFLKFPHDDLKWPSKPQHRKLIDFLDNEAMHGPKSIAEFAAGVGLCRAASAYTSIYDERS